MTTPYRGSCLCGAIRFEVDEFLPESAHCHCSMCRKFHGAEYATYASIKEPHFRWTAGEDALQSYVAENGTTRQFCRHCGSSLTFSSPRASSDEVEIALATVDDDVPIRPNAHIFLNYAANWTVIDDELQCFGEGRRKDVQ
ncbi:MAG: GFA family protein [Woeseiaceae bacterium]|nr:GFA family protein [Woeseiaceae bacterium]